MWSRRPLRSFSLSGAGFYGPTVVTFTRGPLAPRSLCLVVVHVNGKVQRMVTIPTPAAAAMARSFYRVARFRVAWDA